MRQQYRKYILRRMMLLFLFCLSLLVFTGCASLKSEQAVRKNVKRTFPDSAFLFAEETPETEETLPSKYYTFENQGIRFHVKDQIYRDSLFGLRFESISSDYWAVVLEQEEPSFSQIARQSGLDVQFSGNGSSISVKINLEHYDEFENVQTFLDSLFDALYDRLPAEILVDQEGNQKDFVRGQVTVNLTGPGADGEPFSFFQDAILLQQADPDWFGDRCYAEYFYIDAVIDGDLSRSSIDGALLTGHPALKLYSLCINGEKYTSQRYPTEFVYDAKTEQYYTVVCFGMQVDYNGGVDDYLQREILETFYPDCGYTIDYSRRTSTYTINGSQFRIKRDRSTNDLRFYQNRRELKIEDYAYDFIGHGPTSSGATYNRYVSVEDFAALLGMKLDRIDQGAVWLTQ